MNHALTFLKLGGAVITNKEIPNTLRPAVLQRLSQEIAAARRDNPELLLVIGNGVGSFAHVPAKKYQTMDGFIAGESKYGMAVTQDSAAQANRAVVAALLTEGVPAVSVSPSHIILTDHRSAQSSYLDVLQQYLKFGLQPVTHGDVLADTGQGCTIWSTDTVFVYLAEQLISQGWQVQEMIHVTEAEGVWKDETKQIYERITPQMRAEVGSAMVDTKGTDVTGGMWHKIQESLRLAEMGITTRIMSGLQPGQLYQQLTGGGTFGTEITNEKHEYESKKTSARRSDHGWQPAMGSAT